MFDLARAYKLADQCEFHRTQLGGPAYLEDVAAVIWEMGQKIGKSEDRIHTLKGLAASHGHDWSLV